MPTSRRRPSATRLGLLREELRRIAATAPAPLSRPRSDPEIALLVREGRPHHFAEAADRHRTSVTAYLATCFTDTVQRDDLAARVFEHTAAATAVGGLPGSGLRLQLLVNARTLAVRHWAHTPDDPALDPAFRAWAGLGGTWPMDLRSRLTEAYRLLPRRRRTLLWHGVIEGDSPRTAVLAAGIPADTYRRALDRAMFELRATYLELHRSATLDLPDCADHASLLAAAVAEPASPAALDVLGPHLHACPHCRTAHADLTDLPGQLRAQLPGMLLGWWDPHAYALARAALRAEPATRPARPHPRATLLGRLVPHASGRARATEPTPTDAVPSDSAPSDSADTGAPPAGPHPYQHPHPHPHRSRRRAAARRHPRTGPLLSALTATAALAWAVTSLSDTTPGPVRAAPTAPDALPSPDTTDLSTPPTTPPATAATPAVPTPTIHPTHPTRITTPTATPQSPTPTPPPDPVGYLLTSATDVLYADDHSAEQGTLPIPGTTPAARTFTPGGQLRYDNIDFGTAARTRALLTYTVPPGSTAPTLTLRLDSPTAPPVAVLPADGTRREIPLATPTTGVHTVYVTASCTGTCPTLSSLTFR